MWKWNKFDPKLTLKQFTGKLGKSHSVSVLMISNNCMLYPPPPPFLLLTSIPGTVLMNVTDIQSSLIILTITCSCCYYLLLQFPPKLKQNEMKVRKILENDIQTGNGRFSFLSKSLFTSFWTFWTRFMKVYNSPLKSIHFFSNFLITKREERGI